MKYLFQVSIGPVQTFIASARRTRDLWFGSWLLSELSKTAAREIVEQESDHLDSLIFPAPHDLAALKEDSPLNVANRIVAEITREPGEIGAAVQRAVQRRLGALWHETRAQIQGQLTNEEDATAQILDMIECVWVAVPLAEDYAAARKRLDTLMAARKSTHDFARVSWGGEQPKSSIDGRLESVIPEGRYPPRRKHKRTADERAADEQMIAALFRHYGAGPAERLSGVDLLKRKGQAGDQDRFLSTSHVAAMPFLERLKQIDNPATARGLWDRYIAALKKQNVRMEHIPEVNQRHPILGDCDGAILFEERLNDEVEDTARLEPAKSILREFLSFVNIGRPSPYYAILHADGDSMGAVIDHQAEQGLERHRQLSQALDGFAAAAGSIVHRYQGAPIYTGGDDVLALLPLHWLLECGAELAKIFCESLAEFEDKNDRSATLSVGAAIVHHLMPLVDALELARATEKRAKDVPGKNALAITVSKRSGGETTIQRQWEDVDTRLRQLIDLHRAGALPHGVAYELQSLAERLRVPEHHQDHAALSEVAQIEAGRILRRKQIDKNILAQLQELLEPRTITIGEFADQLIVAELLADAEQLAGKEAQA